MSLTYGFFDALNEDRTYDSLDFGKMFDGVINDGILAGVSGQMKVTAGSGLSVSIAPGKAWYNRRWALNDAAVTLSLDAAHATLPRIDVVVLELDETARSFSFKIVKGTPDASPIYTALTDNATVHQYALANVTVPGGASSISNSNIDDARVIATVVSELINGYPRYTGLTETTEDHRTWNVEIRAGRLSPSITLPDVPEYGSASAEIRYIFTAASASASFTAPSNYILGQYNFIGLSPGNTLTFTNLVAGSIYEVSFAVLDGTHIGMVMNEWPIA